MALRERVAGRLVADVLGLRAGEDAERTFVVYESRRLSYGDVNAQADALAAALHGLGIEAGDRVAVILPNWPEFVVTMFAVAKIGAIIVPLNPKFTPTELQYMLRHSETVAAVTVETLDGVDYLERFESFLGALPELQYVISVGEQDLWYDDRIYQFEDLLSSGRGRSYPAPAIDPAANVFAILYTSGTMGKPKGVALTHANLLLTAAATVEAIGLAEDDAVFGITTLFNVFGLGPGILGTAVTGARVLLRENDDPRSALDLMERERATVHYGVPTNFITELREPSRTERDLGSIRTGIVAGAPVSEDLILRIQRELVPDIRVAYGMTETGSTVAMSRADDSPGKQITTVGRPLPGVELKVLDLDGTPLPEESVGELAVRGPGVMQGYHRQPGDTAAAFTENGFFLTGDLGMVDDEGYLHLLGRRKEVIIRGGFNVYPREVEDRLHAHPAVLDVAVVGLPDEILGELTCACIVPVEGAIVTGEEIKEFCREALAEYKVPDLVRFMDTFPMTGSGKIRRIELARMVSATESSRRV